MSDIYELTDMLYKYQRENPVVMDFSTGAEWASYEESMEYFRSWTTKYSQEWEELRHKLGKIASHIQAVAWIVNLELRKAAESLDNLNFIC